MRLHNEGGPSQAFLLPNKYQNLLKISLTMSGCAFVSLLQRSYGYYIPIFVIDLKNNDADKLITT